MKIRVEIAIEEPLKQDLILERDVGENSMLVFKYEKLGMFCFIFGSLGHTNNFCHKKYEKDFVNGEKKVRVLYPG